MTTTQPQLTSVLLTLPEIASWQVKTPPAQSGKINVALPALQRSAVWKVAQIEDLWDSIFRRFPVGSFIIAPPDDRLKQKRFKLQSEKEAVVDPDYLLLDGQQRATGIALGFYDIWTNEIDAARSTLWIDISSPPSSRDVDFVFRVTTRAHPWGYRKTDPNTTLSSSQIRAALLAYQTANENSELRPEDLLLQQTWPWDASAPIPVSFILSAVLHNRSSSEKVREYLHQRLKQLPILNDYQNKNQQTDLVDRTEQDAHRHHQQQRNQILEALENPSSQSGIILQSVISRISGLIFDKENHYQIPALPLNLSDTAQTTSTTEEEPVKTYDPDAQDVAKKDAIELLFVRVNSAGTPLAGEELTYSLLKSAWPDAANFIDSLDHKPAQPSRIATLCIRLILARQQHSSNKKGVNTLPNTPGINEFRRLVRNEEFLSQLTDFIRTEANDLFSKTWEFLTAQSFGLLPYLAVEIARQSVDVYFLMMYWMDKLSQTNSLPNIKEKTHRRTLGFITAVAWFAQDKRNACAALWPQLMETDPDNLLDFFNKKAFAQTNLLDRRLSLRMIPLPSADEFELWCRKSVLGHQGCRDTVSSPDSTIWDSWNWYTSFADKLAKDPTIQEKWEKRLSANISSSEDDEELDYSGSVSQASRIFADTVYNSRSILLYAQREWVRRWYPKFDPSQPEYMEDRNRPWDYDHILPQNLLRSPSGNSRRNIPQVIWDWVGSIGNLRAWPLEANRSDSDTSPTLKLTDISIEEKRYSMINMADLIAASFIQKDVDWQFWEGSVPVEKDSTGKVVVTDRRYLALAKYHDNRAS